MGIFRKKTKLQITNVKAIAARAIYQNHDFPTIDVTMTAQDVDNARRAGLTEVTASMTLWEAAKLTQQLHNAVSAGQMTLPKKPVNVPWGEG